jgi:hypothetical protein
VCQLDPRAGGDDLVRHPRAELGGQQRQQRPEPLPTGLREVGRRLRDKRVVVVDGGQDEVVDAGQPVLDPGRQLGRDARDGEHGG